LSYIGKTPTPAPLTSSDITDGIITTTKIADANVTNPKLTSGSQQNFRNIIINGDMSLAQRTTSKASLTGSSYETVDRFKQEMTSGGTWTQSQSTDVPTGQGFAKSLKMDCTTANGSLSSNSNLIITQKIEGQNLQYIKKGTSSAESLTASFWVKSNKTGTYISRIRDADNSRSISKSYTISSANTWEKKTITFAGDTTGALNNDNGTSLQLYFYLLAGTDYTSGTLATSWEANTNANIAVGQVNLADSTSNEWYITGVQLEAGTSASDFEFLPVDVNLERCYRYYRTIVPLNSVNTGYAMAFYTSTGNVRFSFTLDIPMRVTPSIDYITGSGYFKVFAAGSTNTLNSWSLQDTATNRFILANNTGEASGTAGFTGYAQAGSNSAYLALEAEL